MGLPFLQLDQVIERGTDTEAGSVQIDVCAITRKLILVFVIATTLRTTAPVTCVRTDSKSNLMCLNELSVGDRGSTTQE
jgi:hypothetical protein